MDTTGILKSYLSVPPKCRFHLGFSLVGYYEDMKACCRDYMSSVTDEELSATMSLRPGSDPEPKETIMGVLVFDNIVHGGQIAFLRGHLEGMGWFV